jgi:hypothetical protein
MSSTGVDVFDITLQKTSIWLKGLLEEKMGWDQ